jgi:hypothetical protein
MQNWEYPLFEKKNMVFSLIIQNDRLKSRFFLRWDPVTDTDTHPYERTHAQPTLWAPPKNQFRPTNLKIDEVTTGVSLLTGMSSATESISSLNLRKNSEKYEHQCQVRDLNPGGQVPAQET